MSSAFQYAVFFALCLVPFAVGGRPLLATSGLALAQDAYTHILLIVPISVALIAVEWRRKACKPNASWLAGLGVLALAALIGLAGLGWGGAHNAGTGVPLAWQMLAIVVWWIGAFLGCFGWRTFRACLFPLLFLLLLIPIPTREVNYIVQVLQIGTASFARVLLTWVGVPVLQDGTVIAIPGLTLEVAQQCSSIRSSMMLVVSTLVLCYLLLRSVWGRSAVILAAVPFSIAKNGLRVFTLAVLGRYVDRGYLTGSLHHNGGPLFFALALAMVFGLIGLLRWIERETDQLPATEHPRKSRSRSVADFSTLTSAEPDHACEVKR